MEVVFRYEPRHDPKPLRGAHVRCSRCGERIRGLWESKGALAGEGYPWLWSGTKTLGNCQTEIVDGEHRWRHIECGR